MRIKCHRAFAVLLTSSLFCSALSALAAPALAGSSAPAGSSSKNDLKLSISSSAFRDGDPLPRKYTGDGSDVSPPLRWAGAPSNALSVALMCFDTDAPKGTWYHWILFNISPTRNHFDEGVPKIGRLPDGEEQGSNDFGRPGYNGPAPPPGKLHHYHFRIMALDRKLDLNAGIGKDAFLQAINGHVVGQGEIVGTYKR